MKTFLWSFILFAGLAGLSACDEDERVTINTCLILFINLLVLIFLM